MWDLGVPHEYVVRRGGTHAGPEMFAVQRAALAFIGDGARRRGIAGRRVTTTTSGYRLRMTPARPPIVSQAEWNAALASITEREESVAAAMDELAAARKRMPMVRVEHDYRFEGPDGDRSLAELFDGRSQLILYRFFFEEGVGGWPDAGCVGCSSFADGIPDLGLVHARDITFAMASPAPQANIRRYAERMGWTDVPWYTIRTDRFSADFGVDRVVRPQRLPARRRRRVPHVLPAARADGPEDRQRLERVLAHALRRAGRGRGRARRWPQAPWSFWFRRHDEFDEPAPSARASARRRQPFVTTSEAS